MIIYLLLLLIYGLSYVLISPVRLLADASVGANYLASIASAGQYLGMVEVIMPVEVILTIFGLFLAIESGIFVYKLVMWVKNLVW